MKKIILGAILAIGLSVNAQAYYECQATSPSAWGIGQANSRAQAKNIALNQCASRTPGWQLCVINWCEWR